MPVEELLLELPAMLADDKAASTTQEEEEGAEAFLKAGTVDSYIAAVLQLYKV